MTAVLGLLGLSHHSCADGVQVNVSHKLGKVLIRLTENRLIAPLEQLTALFEFAVMVLTVRGKQPLHQSADEVIESFDQQMNVIGHQAISKERTGAWLSALRAGPAS